MNKVRFLQKLIKGNDGVTAVMIGVLLMVLAGFASLAIDIGHLCVVRNALQNSADAAALAAASSMIQSTGSGTQVDSTDATNAAINVAQLQSQASGQPSVANSARNDITIIYGTWDITKASSGTAWTAIGPSPASNSAANAVQVTISRDSGTVYGPVTNFFAGVFNINTSEVTASAIAYLGYANEALSGSVQVPLALPETILQAANTTGRKHWLARALGPKEAVATTTKTLVFKDTGGANVPSNVPTSPVANLDSNQPYWYTGYPNPGTNQIPNTVWETMEKIYTPGLTGSSSVPVALPNMTLGQQIYPVSEYPWGRQWVGPMFQYLQKAYYYKTTGNAGTAPAAGTPWSTTLAVFGLKTASLKQPPAFRALARLLTPFWASEVFACSSVTYPAISVVGFASVTITGVTYNSTTSDDGNYNFPYKIGGVTYTSKLNFLTNYPNSTWNCNSATINNIVSASTLSSEGTLSGGPPNKSINPNAPANVGPFAQIPRLVK